MSKLNVALSPRLEQYRDRIEATAKPYIAIKETASDNLSWWQSKFGGLPYLPQGMEYPQTPNGDYLHLLAQINFDETPPLEGFPDTGILQVYVAQNISYGANLDDFRDRAGFQILYFAEVERDASNIITNFDFLPTIDEFDFPIRTPCSLEFNLQVAPVNSGDYQFSKLVGAELDRLLSEDDELREEYEETFFPYGSGGSSRIGGYPIFTQSDPRPFASEGEEPFVLLLQIDSNWDGWVQWGDMGIGNFFIQKSALEKLDFTNVIYNWDCG